MDNRRFWSFGRARKFTVDGHELTTKERQLNGCQIGAMTPYFAANRIILLERMGEPDLVVGLTDDVPINGGESFITVPRGTWGG